MRTPPLSISTALAVLLTAGCRSVTSEQSLADRKPLQEAPATSEALVTLDSDAVEVLRRLLGIDGNGIDIRPKYSVPMTVTFHSTVDPSQTSPYETVDIELHNHSTSAKSLTIEIPGAPATTLAAGDALSIKYTYEDKSSGAGRRLRFTILGQTYEARLNPGSNYGPNSRVKAPISKLLNRAGDTELLIDVHGLKTPVVVKGLFTP